MKARRNRNPAGAVFTRPWGRDGCRSGGWKEGPGCLGTLTTARVGTLVAMQNFPLLTEQTNLDPVTPHLLWYRGRYSF
jgi:hypothetical protein